MRRCAQLFDLAYLYFEGKKIHGKKPSWNLMNLVYSENEEKSNKNASKLNKGQGCMTEFK